MRMRRTLIPLLAAVLTFTATSAGAQAALTATPIATGLAFPNALTVAFYGERLGKIGWIDPVTGARHAFATIPIRGMVPGHGIQSLALHPQYPAQPYLYVTVARSVGGVGRVQLLRLTNSGGRGTGLRTLFQAPAGSDHNASRVAFGKDGKLYMAIGEAGNPAKAQNLNVPNGKVLRMTLLGGIPSGNPFPNSRIWAYGLRNTIGMARSAMTRSTASSAEATMAGGRRRHARHLRPRPATRTRTAPPRSCRKPGMRRRWDRPGPRSVTRHARSARAARGRSSSERSTPVTSGCCNSARPG
jgi:glucose/sorbosone dehydrogenase